MAGRLVQLSSAKGGISRLRVKGGAEKDTLYDLVNGYVDGSGSCVIRPGTVADYELPPGTVGLCSVNGALVVFSHVIVSGMPAGVTCEVLTHPTSPTLALANIHFAGPFLGGADGAYLYVVAEFSNGDVFHYWLQRADAWAGETDYTLGQLVQPSIPNGYTYRATRTGAAPITWAPDVARTVGDVVVPTTENGFDYTVIDVVGSDPRSGTAEPTWPESDGATVYEDTNLGTPAAPTDGTGSQDLPTDISDRYGKFGAIV